MCIGGFNNLRGLFLFISFGLASLFSVNGLGQEDHFRFASNRVVMVQLSSLEKEAHPNCRRIRQKDSLETSFRSLHLHGTDALRIVDMAVGLDDTVMIVGLFSGDLVFEGKFLQASHRPNPFYLILDHEGLPVAFEKLDDFEWGDLFGVELNVYGEFELQGSSVLDPESEEASVEPMMALVDQSGRLLDIYKPDLQFLLDESDEEEVSDPGGEPLLNPNRLLDESDEEEVSDPGGVAQVNPDRLLDDSDEEEVSDPGGVPLANPNGLLDDSDEEEVSDPGGL